MRGIGQASARRHLETVGNCGLVEVVIRDGVFADPSGERFAKRYY
jgi:hypothetical protein